MVGTSSLVACFLAPVLALAPSPSDPLVEGLSDAPNGHLSMLFEVTFMKIDIANVDVWLSDEGAAAISPLLADGEKGREERIAQAALETSDLAIRLRFRRDAGLDRLLGGMRGNLECAVKDGIVDRPFADSLLARVETDFQKLADRGVRKGDELSYRVRSDGAHSVYRDPEGAVLVEIDRPGAKVAASVRGAYFGPSSRFRQKLVRSLVEAGD